jgi:hypothetical protein
MFIENACIALWNETTKYTKEERTGLFCPTNSELLTKSRGEMSSANEKEEKDWGAIECSGAFSLFHS